MPDQDPETFRAKYENAKLEELVRLRLRLAQAWKLAIVDDLIAMRRRQSLADRLRSKGARMLIGAAVVLLAGMLLSICIAVLV